MDNSQANLFQLVVHDVLAVNYLIGITHCVCVQYTNRSTISSASDSIAVALLST